MTAGPLFGGELVLPIVGSLPDLPEPGDTSLRLKAAFRDAVERERQRRGDVVDEAVVYPMVRAVEGFRDLAKDYERAFKTVAADAAEVLVDELVEVRGESEDGIPNGALYVPDADGSFIKVKAKTVPEHDIDDGQVLAVVALRTAIEWAANNEEGSPDQRPEEFAVAVAKRVLAMFGSAKLQVTHVRALAAELAAAGQDDLAEAAAGAIRTTRVMKGPEVGRVTEDQMKRARARARRAS